MTKLEWLESFANKRLWLDKPTSRRVEWALLARPIRPVKQTQKQWREGFLGSHRLANYPSRIWSAKWILCKSFCSYTLIDFFQKELWALLKVLLNFTFNFDRDEKIPNRIVKYSKVINQATFCVSTIIMLERGRRDGLRKLWLSAPRWSNISLSSVGAEICVMPRLAFFLIISSTFQLASVIYRSKQKLSMFFSAFFYSIREINSMNSEPFTWMLYTKTPHFVSEGRCRIWYKISFNQRSELGVYLKKQGRKEVLFWHIIIFWVVS